MAANLNFPANGPSTAFGTLLEWISDNPVVYWEPWKFKYSINNGGGVVGFTPQPVEQFDIMNPNVFQQQFVNYDASMLNPAGDIYEAVFRNNSVLSITLQNRRTISPIILLYRRPPNAACVAVDLRLLLESAFKSNQAFNGDITYATILDRFHYNPNISQMTNREMQDTKTYQQGITEDVEYHTARIATFTNVQNAGVITQGPRPGGNYASPILACVMSYEWMINAFVVSKYPFAQMAHQPYSLITTPWQGLGPSALLTPVLDPILQAKQILSDSFMDRLIAYYNTTNLTTPQPVMQGWKLVRVGEILPA